MAGFIPGLIGGPLQGSLTPFKLTFGDSLLRPPQLQLPAGFFHMHVNAADGTFRCDTGTGRYLPIIVHSS